MGKISLGLEYGANLAKRFLGKGTKSAVETAQTVPAKIQPLTKTLTDPITGAATGLEREIVLEGGEKGLARLDYLGEGKRKITIFDNENRPFLWETKTVSREEGGSVFGGNRINIDKDKTKYWCYGENIRLQKDYSKTGTLEHKELDFNHSSGNGLNDYAYKASMDKVYSEYPLKSGYKDMQTRPYDTVGVQHSLTRSNGYTETNYGKFSQKGTNYLNTIEAKKAAEQAKIAEAEAAKAAAIKAEQEAAEKLAASRPKVNTGKIFNKNIEEFKCVEETRADGSIIRRYFDPYASNGKSNPMITTIDRGNYHEEIIYDPRKGIKLTYKQLGTGEPEIEMTKGLQYRYTSKYNKRTAYRENTQQYNDGQNFVESHGRDNYTPKQLVTKNPHSMELQAQRGEPEYIKRALNNTYEQDKALAKRFDEIKQDMAHNEVDLIDLFRPYKP